MDLILLVMNCYFLVRAVFDGMGFEFLKKLSEGNEVESWRVNATQNNASQYNSTTINIINATQRNHSETDVSDVTESLPAAVTENLNFTATNTTEAVSISTTQASTKATTVPFQGPKWNQPNVNISTVLQNGHVPIGIGIMENNIELFATEKTPRLSAMKCHQLKEQRVKLEEALRLIDPEQVEAQAIDSAHPERAEFPHMAMLGWPDKQGSYNFRCGGTLVSDSYVLTSAHCTENLLDTVSKTPTIVRIGDIKVLKQLGMEPVDVNIKRLVLHPEYRPPVKYNDIALVELDEPIKQTLHIRPACIWNNFHQEGRVSAIVTGWAVPGPDTTELDEYQQKAVIKLMVTQVCTWKLRHMRGEFWQGFGDQHLCAAYVQDDKYMYNEDDDFGPDYLTCQGEASGPLHVHSEADDMFYVLGVMAFGSGRCDLQDHPAVYSWIFAFLPWIESVIWPGEKAPGH